jgi:flagellar basal-body rod protein FlgF
MIRGLYTAARGMSVEQKKQETISNNMANSTTVGFKKDITLTRSFPELLTLKVKNGEKTTVGFSGQGALLDSVVTRHSPGSLEGTGQALDFALGGSTAFFKVLAPQGIRYTRDGRFSLDSDGFLVNSDGCFVLDTENNRLSLQSDRVKVDADGVIWSGEGDEKQRVGQLAVPVFDDLGGLEKRGQTLFEAVNAEPVGLGTGQVRQGFLEQSNINLISEMVNMISVMRTYEANQKALQAQDEILGKSVNEVGNLR